MNKPVVLIIRDGLGYSEKKQGNALEMASTPFHDKMREKHARSILQASGDAIGLLPGYMGNSEVNHLNMGAGRVVHQDLKRIHDAIAGGSFFDNRRLKLAMERCVAGGHGLHIFGIVQTSAVHAHNDHLKALLKMAESHGVQDIYIHALTDGRDSSPRSFAQFLGDLLPHFGRAHIATMQGRHVLDRGGDYALTERAYRPIVFAEGARFTSPEEALQDGYNNHQSPDGSPMTDEYLPPSIIGDYEGVKEGDSVVFFNFRQDRAVQITRAFEQQMWDGPEVFYTGFTKYYDEFEDYAFAPLDPEKEMRNILGEVLSREGLSQLRIADSQKFRHVTSFINGKRIEPFPGEHRIEVALPHPDQYTKFPDQGAVGITEIVTKVIEHGVYDFILINFANCDVVGHTTDEAAILKAVEVVDECTKRVVNATLKRGGVALVTADHGNADSMYDEDGQPRSAHTTNPVECFLVSKDSKEFTLKPDGIIPDIAPTILDLLEIQKPSEMTAESLLQ